MKKIARTKTAKTTTTKTSPKTAKTKAVKKAKTVIKPLKAKPTAKPKPKARQKSAAVVQKDIPLHTLIDQVIVIYLKELVMNYRVAFSGDAYVKATTDSGTHYLHGEFYHGCGRYAKLSQYLKAMQDAEKMRATDVADPETLQCFELSQGLPGRRLGAEPEVRHASYRTLPVPWPAECFYLPSAT